MMIMQSTSSLLASGSKVTPSSYCSPISCLFWEFCRSVSLICPSLFSVHGSYIPVSEGECLFGCHKESSRTLSFPKAFTFLCPIAIDDESRFIRSSLLFDVNCFWNCLFFRGEGEVVDLLPDSQAWRIIGFMSGCPSFMLLWSMYGTFFTLFRAPLTKRGITYPPPGGRAS